jgi:hypothetical protein
MELHTHKRLNILFKNSFRILLQVTGGRLVKQIKAMPDNLFSSQSVDDFVNDLSEEYKIGDLPIIFWEKGTTKISIVKLTSQDLPSSFDRGFSGTIERKKIDFFIPMSDGRHDIMVYREDKIDYSKPFVGGMSYSTKTFNPVGVPYVIDGNKLQFTYIDLWQNPEKTNETFSDDKKIFNEFYLGLKTTIEEYNFNLPNILRSLINKRIDKSKRDKEYESKLVFPIVSDPNVTDFFIPKKVLKSKKIQPKSKKITQDTPVYEWYITEDDYMNILKLLHDCGKMWEKYPRLYRGRDEETLRDQLLFVLVPNIIAVVAGEAYNKKGKTDISIKHENTNLFIGECKIWKGPKTLIETINQILKYLTWRDSKSAVLNFVPNDDFIHVLDSAEKTIQQHPNYIGKIKEYEKGWSNYSFHLSEKSDVIITIAFQFIHTPELYSIE